jgi:hypothetical protein
VRCRRGNQQSGQYDDAKHKWHLALRYRHLSLPQSSSASRFTAGASFYRDNASRFNEVVEVAIVSLPLCNCVGTRCASDITASNFAALMLGSLYRAVPWLFINQRSLDRELLAVVVDDNQEELGLFHVVSLWDWAIRKI